MNMQKGIYGFSMDFHVNLVCENLINARFVYHVGPSMLWFNSLVFSRSDIVVECNSRQIVNTHVYFAL